MLHAGAFGCNLAAGRRHHIFVLPDHRSKTAQWSDPFEGASIGAFFTPETVALINAIRQRVQVDDGCPDGCRKIFLFLFFRNHVSLGKSRLIEEGRFAIVTDVEAGSGGRIESQRGSVLRRRTVQMRTAKPCGPGIPELMPAQCVDALSRKRGQESRSPGRARSKPSNHCAGKAGYWLSLWFCRVLFCCTRTMGIGRYPVFPAPSRCRRVSSRKARAQRAARTLSHELMTDAQVRRHSGARRSREPGIHNPRTWCEAHAKLQSAITTSAPAYGFRARAMRAPE